MEHLTVVVRPRASRERLSVLPDGTIKVWVMVPPEHERANQRVITLLANHLDVPKRTVHITHGQHATTKLVAIYDESIN